MKDKLLGVLGLGVSFLSAWVSSKFFDSSVFVSVWLGIFSLVVGIASLVKFFGTKIRTGYY